MFRSRKGRSLEKGMLVAVHWNSHQNCYSVIDMKSENSIGHVLGYTNQITLIKGRTKIDKSKQQKVKKEEKKDRHAFIVGYFDHFESENLEKRVYYHPSFLEDFVDGEDYFSSGCVSYIETMEKVHLTSENQKPKVTYRKTEK